MKERPILFSGAMVRAILEGRKTVTRRVVKPQYLEGPWSVRPATAPRHARHSHDWWLPTGSQPYAALPPCPFGQVGDRLWVRESWQDVHPVQVAEGRYAQPGRAGIPGPPGVTYQTIYRADGPYPVVYHCHGHPYRCLQPDPAHLATPAEGGYTGWTPSIHMPRWASRILLEVTAVRVERLQAISRADIRAEGLVCPPELASDDVSPNYRDWYPAAFRRLWESTGGDWAGNPWVWVVEFRRVTP
ncbi:hypothetical protein I5P84_00570 [Pseudomonas mosselii]|uniref:hypothetical protein n=1 Tax=Pseudomonas mosselii TaxID=78327 RepID=UPI0018DA2EBA|nr:hypothetical protein [Pseudomonas mosselii]MBH3307946.1 hypothetical protein [Pseudomonas mosselii]MBH3326564.1 hypothetical protein [Pseudomonas mosselii]